MLLWAAIFLLTVFAVLAILLPVLRATDGVTEGSAFDLEVYKDQLAELERDASRGLIDEREAGEARAEISRRILGLDAASTDGSPSGSRSSTRWAVLASVLAVPIVGIGTYGFLGSPQISDQPLQQRLADARRESGNLAEAPIVELIAKAEEQLARNPEDGRGWAILAPIYMRVGRFDDSTVAFSNAIELLGSSLEFEAGHGEALVGKAGGIVTAEAQAAFERALALNPADVRSRYYMATAHVQDGRLEKAVAAWQELLSDTEGTAAWRKSAETALIETRRRLALQSPAAPAKGPDKETVEAASEMSTEDRNEMIASMVARLDERLRQNANDLPGWKQLVRSYLVLGKSEEARQALLRGAAAVGDAKPELLHFGQSLGLKIVEQDP